MITRLTGNYLLFAPCCVKEKLPQAGDQLNQLPKNLSGAQQTERQLLTAELQIANKSYVSARSTLGHLDSASLSPNQKVRYYQAQIAANQGKASLPLDPRLYRSGAVADWQTAPGQPGSDLAGAAAADAAGDEQPGDQRRRERAARLAGSAARLSGQQARSRSAEGRHQRLAEPLSEEPGGQNAARSPEPGAELHPGLHLENRPAAAVERPGESVRRRHPARLRSGEKRRFHAGAAASSRATGQRTGPNGAGRSGRHG